MRARPNRELRRARPGGSGSRTDFAAEKRRIGRGRVLRLLRPLQGGATQLLLCAQSHRVRTSVMVNGFTLGVAYRAKVASDDKRGRHMSCSDCMSKQQQAQAKSGRVSSGGADRDRPQARRSGRVQGWVIQSLQLVGANQETSAPTLLLPDVRHGGM